MLALRKRKQMPTHRQLARKIKPALTRPPQPARDLASVYQQSPPTAPAIMPVRSVAQTTPGSQAPHQGSHADRLLAAMPAANALPAQRNSTQSHFFFNDTAPTEIYTLSLHDALLL